MKTALRSVLAASAAVAFMLAAANAPVRAQESTPETPPAASKLDDATVKKFAGATLDIEDVVKEWKPRVEKAKNEQEANELRRQATNEMEEAVRSNGLEIKTYNQIFQAAQANPELASAIKKYREDMR